MNILIAADSFKDALSARAVCAAIAAGVRDSPTDAEVIEFPLADGGEGTLDVLLQHLGGERRTARAHDPLFREIEADWALLDNRRLALVEMAAASGIQLLQSTERHAPKTTTLGTGELILEALAAQPKQLVIGLGGSATNDGGMGMATALGYRFLDASGNQLHPCGENLAHIARINGDKRRFVPGDLPVAVICDVDNPLTGPRGASHTYGPQKGASQQEVEQLEAGMKHYARLLADFFGRDIGTIPGAGAAGGMGAACLAYLGAELRSGVELIMELCNFDLHLKDTNLIFTGEGRIDSQTLHGKLIGGICRRAAARNIPVVGLCGALSASTEEIRQIGLRAAFSIAPGPVDLPTALAQTGTNLRRTAAQVVALLR